MKIKLESSSKKKTELLCGFILEETNKVLGLPKYDTKTTSSINQSIKDNGGKLGNLTIIPISGKKPAQRILLAGIGKKDKITNDTIRNVSGKIALKARELKLKEFTIVAPPSFVKEVTASVSQIVEGAKMSLYKFDKFKAEKEVIVPNLTIVSSKSTKISKALKSSEIIADGAIFTKSIANLPPNECSPSTLASFAKTISNKNKMKCKIISKSELKKNGFGGITAVGQGSKNEPKLIIMEHNHGSKNKKPIVLVGKSCNI